MDYEARQLLAKIHKKTGAQFLADTPMTKYFADEARLQARKIKESNMRGPYGFEMNENCQTCKLQKEGFFCQLQATDAAKSSSVYPEGAVLFIEKQEPRGVFVLCEGQVKLSISSSEGKTLILRIAKPGEVLGLTAVVGGTPYEVTAETLRPCQVAFIRRDDFLRFIAQNPEVYRNIVKQMVSSHQGVCEQLRNIGLLASAPARLAKLLLDWSDGVEQTKSGFRITMPLTHEEIGEFIGSSRETVTRTFSEFKNRHLVALKGSTVMIPNRNALELKWLAHEKCVFSIKGPAASASPGPVQG